MFKRLLKKLRSSAGASLGEMLLCVLILLLAGSALTSGVVLASNHFEKSFSSSQAQTICSTLMSAVENELRYTTEVTVTMGEGYIAVLEDETVTEGGGAVTDFAYRRPRSSLMVCFSVDDDGRVEIQAADESAAAADDSDATGALVAPGTYSHGLSAEVRVSSISTERTGGEVEITCYHVTITISRGGTNVVESAAFDVIPVVHPKVTEQSAA